MNIYALMVWSNCDGWHWYAFWIPDLVVKQSGNRTECLCPATMNYTIKASKVHVLVKAAS